MYYHTRTWTQKVRTHTMAYQLTGMPWLDHWPNHGCTRLSKHHPAQNHVCVCILGVHRTAKCTFRWHTCGYAIHCPDVEINRCAWIEIVLKHDNWHNESRRLTDHSLTAQKSNSHLCNKIDTIDWGFFLFKLDQHTKCVTTTFHCRSNFYVSHSVTNYLKLLY